MDAREYRSFPRTPPAASFALGVVTAIAIASGFAMAGAWFVLLLGDDGRAAPQGRSADAPCRICGVVDRVRELPPAPGQALEGSRAEGTVNLIAALGGARPPGARTARVYETAVIHDDGSVRVLRDSRAPLWLRGDRVKVIKGRVEPVFSPAERTPTPVPPVAQAP